MVAGICSKAINAAADVTLGAVVVAVAKSSSTMAVDAAVAESVACCQKSSAMVADATTVAVVSRLQWIADQPVVATIHATADVDCCPGACSLVDSCLVSVAVEADVIQAVIQAVEHLHLPLVAHPHQVAVATTLLRVDVV